MQTLLSSREKFRTNARSEECYLALLTSCDDAAAACSEASNHVKNSSETGKPNKMSTLDNLKGYLTYLKISTEMSWKESMITCKDGIKTVGVIGVLHLYDSIWQGSTKILELLRDSAKSDDNDFLVKAEAEEARVRALRCYYLGLTYAGNDDFTAALTLFDHAQDLAQTAASKLAMIAEEGGSEDADEQAKSMIELEETILSSRCRAKAEQFLSNNLEESGAGGDCVR